MTDLKWKDRHGNELIGEPANDHFPTPAQLWADYARAERKARQEVDQTLMKHFKISLIIYQVMEECKELDMPDRLSDQLSKSLANDERFEKNDS